MYDASHMKRALDLARRGAGLVSPNPMVGAVLVKDGRVVGEGFHRYDRLKHAEVIAIEMAGRRSRGADLYCSLEPCCHYGRTPPCTDALIEAGIARAVIAITDPDRRVRGRGIEQLRAAGISVEVGLCEAEARRLNESYFKFITAEMPFVHAIIEQAAGESSSAANSTASSIDDWLPSPQLLRSLAEYDAIVLGEREQVNRLVIGAALERERHRKLILAGTRYALERAGADSLERGPAGATVITLPPRSYDKAAPDLISLLRRLTDRLRVTSVALLASAQAANNAEIIDSIDKVTIVRASLTDHHSIKLSETVSSSAGEFVELTGYPCRSAAT
jgi:pyrimidine deaminase RibD-like protein